MDNDGGCKRFILVDDEYKFFFDHHLSGDNSFGIPPFDDDNGDSETRNLGFEFYCDSKRTKLGGGCTEKKLINNRVSQKRKRETNGFEGEFSRGFPVATTRESIERDNRVAERRKMKMAEFEGARVSRNQGDSKARKVSESKVDTLRDVPLVRATQRDNKARKVSESTEVNTLRDVPLVRAIPRDNNIARKVSESTKVNTLRGVPLVRATQRDYKASKVSESKVNTLRDVPLVRAKEPTQRDSKARKVSESTKVNTLRDVPLVRAKEVIQRDSKARKVSESIKVDTLQDVPLFRTKEAIRRDNKARRMSESTKVDTLRSVPLGRAKETIQRDSKAKKLSESKVDTLQDVPLFRNKEVIRRGNMIAETKAAGTSRVVHVERVNRVTEPKAVDKTPRFVQVTQSNKGVSEGTKKKNVAVVDKDYMSYLTWLVDSLKDSTTVPGPTPETQKQSTMALEKDHLAKGKVELDTESCSDDDDDDIIMVSDSPFCCGGSTPFVVSKSKTVIDLEKDSTEDEGISFLYMKELMEALEKPYDKRELLRLSGEVSEKKPVSRCRELRKGRVSSYETSELGPSYLEKVSDFDKEYRRVDGDDDKARLKLLRGFFFYLKNVTRAGAFKPWLPENQKKLGLRKQCLQPKKG